MKKVTAIITICCFFVMCCSCTNNLRARQYGGTTTIELEPGQKLVEATWKKTNIWYLTEPMEPGYEPKTKTFQENSCFGVMEGTVIFVERR